MSESDGDQIARSVALEQAYVHEVYEQCAEKTAQSRHWPKIYQFLEELEPGALVCDIGCGNGKYLSVNHSIFKVGVDRCKRFTDIAREKENEVLICDNLALPFRDESFDAVLSIAVVHHFATTERRVHALKELARVLRIGGRLIISVWAMEQRHRKFESQDVLVPWPKAYCVNTAADGSRRSGIPEENQTNLNEFAQKSSSNSKKNNEQKCKSKGYWIDPIFSPSPSTSSLSSPNETCYSFFRRALQKLAGGKRGSGSRPWFLESWQSGSRNRKSYETDETADTDELPIELRGVEDGNVNLNKQSDSLSIKSKSVGDMLEIQRLDLVRSRSSIPGLCSTLTSELNLDAESRTSSSLSGSKPRLVKQKTHFIDDVGLENPDNTAIQELHKDLPDFQLASSNHSKRGSIVKQSSMNEELMSTDRLEEKARVRRNILKQASLNEELICKGRTFESFRDSLYSGNASKRFQLLKSGLTNRIKQSTTNIEVSGISIKNGFVRILQSWKSNDGDSSTTENAGNDDNNSKNQTNDKVQPVTPVKKEPDGIERRLSREDGSDSSKDSSLQSDTSVDSEDSFASVIFVPKQEVAPVNDIVSTPSGYQLGSTSAPPSPRVKHPPDISSPRLKFISISPLAKQFPITSQSLPSPSPSGQSSHTFNPVVSKQPFSTTTTAGSSQLICSDKVTTTRAELVSNTKFQPSDRIIKRRYSEAEVTEKMSFFNTKLPTPQTVQVCQPVTEPVEDVEPRTMDDTAPLIPDDSSECTIQEKSSLESIQEEESRTARLNQIKELLKQKPGFAMRTKPLFPLVRCATITNTSRLECMTKVLPRLLSSELYNPETDDLDSDSSGVSSPESVGSVISVISDERYTSKKDNTKSDGTGSEVLDSSAENVSAPTDIPTGNQVQIETNKTTSFKKVEDSSKSTKLLEAAANVASSLEDAVGTAIQKTHSGSYSAQIAQRANSIETTNPSSTSVGKISKERTSVRSESVGYQLPEVEDTWSEECRQHLIDFTEKLSGNLVNDIDQYNQETKLVFDDYNDEPEGSYLLRRKSDIKMNMRYKGKPDASLSAARKSCKYNDMSNTIAWLRNTNNGFNTREEKVQYEEVVTTEISNPKEITEETSMHRSTSDDIMDFVMVSNTGEFMNEKESVSSEKFPSEKSYLRPGNSIESSDIGESIENTVSLSDVSQGGSTGRLCSSMVSLLSNNAEYPKTYAEKRRFQIQRRSASEEIPSRLSDSKHSSDCLVTTTGSNDTLSGSSSQESLPSDREGGAITYHQYYHVFREGELDQLINKYVENLHIISSYYDHASWCIVAEKVQVWTI